MYLAVLSLCRCGSLWVRDLSGPLPSTSGTSTCLSASGAIDHCHLAPIWHSLGLCPFFCERAELEWSIRVFPWEWSFASLAFSQVCLCSVLLAPPEYPQGSQPWSFPWGPIPKGWASAPSAYSTVGRREHLGSANQRSLCGEFSPVCLQSAWLAVLPSEVLKLPADPACEGAP